MLICPQSDASIRILVIIVAVCRVHGAPGPEPGYVPAGHDDDVGAVPLDEGEEGR